MYQLNAEEALVEEAQAIAAVPYGERDDAYWDRVDAFLTRRAELLDRAAQRVGA